jgi:hypothetical protein
VVVPVVGGLDQKRQGIGLQLVDHIAQALSEWATDIHRALSSERSAEGM